MALIWLLAGEPSGDVLGARLMDALKELAPETRFTGVGGSLMGERGLRSIFPMPWLSLMGFVEVVPRLPRLYRLLGAAARDIRDQKPAVVVTIDSPGFSLRLLRAIRPLGVRRVHYVAPQIWAWREGRARHFHRLWERLLCLLPFEPEFFSHHGLPATFVGHPVLESGLESGDADRFRARHSLGAGPIVLVMPGSRASEIARLGSLFGVSLNQLRNTFSTLRPIVVAAPSIAGIVRREVAKWPVPSTVIEDVREKPDAFAAADVGLCKSGTSALELALARVPMIVAYRVNPVSAAIARRLVTVRYASLVNILAEREVVPELLQQDCTADRVAATLRHLLEDPALRDRQRSDFEPLMQSLAPPEGSPSRAAARVVLDLLHSRLCDARS